MIRKKKTNKMIDPGQLFLTCFVACVVFATVINAQQIRVDTVPAKETVTENQRNVNLTCRVGRPIGFCTVTLPNREQQVALDPKISPRDGLQYFGNGLENGECGVTIDQITAAHNGQWKCSLFVDGVSVEGFIDVEVAQAPTIPTIEIVPEKDSFEVDTTLVAYCITKNGNPGANLAWYLEDEPIFQGVSSPQEYKDEGQPGITNVLTLQRSIQAADSGKRLVCEAKHIAYPDGVAKFQRKIYVNFAPQALPETTVHGLTLGRTVDVTVTISSNPSPRTSWMVDGDEIEQGMENGRYAAHVPVPLGNDMYNVTLTIAGLTLEDLSKTYSLRGVNQVGMQDYTVLLSSMDTEFDESGGVGIVGIIGIVLAALIVMTTVALILVARATGKWCFQQQSTSTSASNARIGETSDTESADLKQPITKTQRLKILFGKKNVQTGSVKTADSKLTTSAAPTAEFSEEHEVKDPDSENKTGEPAVTKADEPTLVYAELELKPVEHGYQTKPESTEYAEILYVQKPEGDPENANATGTPVAGEASSAPVKSSE
ncbi:fasciclin-3-like [Sabethes cyaneus]|uniref:fasciclin-3-like n=1 Tax=Sabethes cyaneus TaxID=53552 RepID=UPI00237DBF3C|nr:fasciclin-3-like [Sabethes cyaneus]XP_053693732.1 fasciclin-3-like [Sabethes cyaneus]XP_053693733.1 fasciclin-3-like [Sabethes cyaneus]XP_053693734.1 fasciclin-3-like [Sabethes cyaneus]XP_053693735.1 fasciclin-3-like [Sabethes cyaneus]XP_053693736.1 fasciclin-3-like [Sabethes cyaneus]XP_053693737.1 fasciclin-3-like [Sabethes cyaneus]XP_053693738.1 fasciclin-3-like [Sabethes cyaneus]XP_053693739.1 fasciclin-3-like [Sabethes cyaneus]XP_053693740.1 fasciclin-3-like [Sabethes cyaneus]